MTNKPQTLEEWILEYYASQGYLAIKKAKGLATFLKDKILLKEEVDMGEIKEILQKFFDNKKVLWDSPTGTSQEWANRIHKVEDQALADIRKVLGLKENEDVAKDKL